ncbi:MAG TPA: PP2C family serine/threonine-protein phosphatase [Steroidobacteraceae bacterium]|nr:PP2C family serine/threonine-protein phosphatase [Steroidobacteraceae bacterium]
MSANSKDVRAPFTWRSAAMTNQGNVRDHNEDAILDYPDAGLWSVADGMGGHQGGDIASGMIVESLRQLARPTSFSGFVDDVDDRLRAVNAELYARAMSGQGGVSGSTVAVLMAWGRYCLTAWAGDSRVYRFRDGALKQISRDHSESQELLDSGTADANDARLQSNIITRAVGGVDELCLDLELRELRDKDRFLLCSDGLYREVGETDVIRHLAKHDPKQACEGLIQQALSGTCADNVSVVVVHFSGVNRV